MSLKTAVFLLGILSVFLKNIHSASLCQAKQQDGSVCPRLKRIKVNFKQYFDVLFDKTGSNESLYPAILRNASKMCCNESILDFEPVSIGNRSKDTEELIQEERCSKEARNDSALSFFFPVYAKSGQKLVFDDEFNFLELVKSPGPVIMMLTSEKQKMKVPASVAIRGSWPLFVLIISLSTTVGLLGWLLEHSSNPSQFSPWFYKGAWEGFWWAMVTISTVGYGDKVPVAFFSRVLTILWLFCGAIILSLFTANVTSVLTSNQIDNKKSLIGTRIAVLNSKHYFDSNLNVGGTIEEFNSQKEMFDHFESMGEDRVLIPNYFDISRLKENLKKFSVVDVLHEPFQTGLVMVNKLSDENKAFFSCLQKKVKSAKRAPSKDAMPDQNENSAFWTSMLFDQDILKIIYYNLIGIGMIAAIGVFFDVFRYCRIGNKRRSAKRKRKRSEKIEETRLKPLSRRGENV